MSSFAALFDNTFPVCLYIYFKEGSFLTALSFSIANTNTIFHYKSFPDFVNMPIFEYQ